MAGYFQDLFLAFLTVFSVLWLLDCSDPPTAWRYCHVVFSHLSCIVNAMQAQ